MYNKGSPKKISNWNITEYVDVETGEFINKDLYKLNKKLWRIESFEINTVYHEHNDEIRKTITRTNFIRKHEQFKLSFYEQ